jgi:predicted nucleotidyltransferase
LGMEGFSGYNEGDYIRTVDGLFFAVKGGRHPPGMVVAYLRYVPDPGGDRVSGGTRYRRVINLDETTGYLARSYPQYLNRVQSLGMTLQTVPLSLIEEVYEPRERLREVMRKPGTRLEKTIKRFMEAISTESGVQQASFGVSGSLLICLSREGSDVDLNVYGVDEGRRVYDSLRLMRERLSWVQPYTAETVGDVLSSRWGGSHVGLDSLAEVEVRKVLHGRVMGRDYFIRLLRPEPDDAPSTPMGEVTFRAMVLDSSYSIYTPCSYTLGEVQPLASTVPGVTIEVISYRGKFTEQAAAGDRVEVRGTLERVHGPEERFRVVLGGSCDYMVPIDPR